MTAIIGLWGRRFGEGSHRFPTMVVDEEGSGLD
jgi:hypothetical protein